MGQKEVQYVYLPGDSFHSRLVRKLQEIFFFFEMLEGRKKKMQLGKVRSFHWVMSRNRIVSSQESIRGRFLSTGNKRASLSLRCHCSCRAFFSPSDTFGLTVFHYFVCNCHGLTFRFEVFDAHLRLSASSAPDITQSIRRGPFLCTLSMCAFTHVRSRCVRSLQVV